MLKWFRRQSLTFRLSAGILLCVFFGGMALLYFVSHYSQPIVRSHIEDLAQKSLQDLSARLSSIGVETEAAALTMKNTLKGLKTSDVNMMRNILQSALQTLTYDKSDTSHAWIYVFPDGEVVNGTLYSGILEDGEFVFKTSYVDNFYQRYPWFKAVPKEEKNFWSEPYIDEEHPQKPWVVTSLIPFKFSESTDYTGLVAVSIDLADIQKDVLAREFQAGGHYLLTSREGLYIAHPDDNIQLKKTIFDLARERSLPQLDDAGNAIKNGLSGSIQMPYSSVYDASVIFFYDSISDLGWGLYLVFSQKVFFEPLIKFQLKVLTSLLLGLTALFILISWICHRSTKPLLALSKIAIQYGQGDFTAELPEKSSQDEIGIMTEAFHKMRDNLLSYIDVIKKNAAEKQRDKSELEIANQIQQAALPKRFPLHPAFEVYASMLPAKSVGGDFYDAFFIDDNHFAVVIADVSGKGIPAALYMMITKTLIKNIAKTGVPIAEVIQQANNELCGITDADMFVTAFLAILNIKTGVLEYINAGHNSPFYKDKDGYKMLTDQHDIVLGGLSNIAYHVHKIKMKKGDRLFLYTDGISEGQNIHGDFYGEDRLSDCLNNTIQSTEDTIHFVFNDVEKFAAEAEQSDDMTMLELRYDGADENTRVFAADVKNTDEVLQFIQDDMQKNHLPEQSAYKMVVASEEIFSNIAQYAYSKGGMAHISTYIKDGFYYIQYTDYGRDYNPLLKGDPNITDTAEKRRVGGLGIFLVKKMADKVTYKRHNGQNILTIGIKIA